MKEHLPGLTTAAVATVVLAAAGATTFGLYRMGWPATGATNPDSAQRCAIFLLGATLLAGLGGVLSRQRPAAWIALLALTGALATSNGAALAAAALFVLASAALGRRMLALLGAEPANWGWSACMLAGAGAYGTLISLAATFRVHFVPMYLVALLLPLVAERSRLREAAVAWLNPDPRGARLPAAALWVEAVTGAVALLYFAVALLPEIGQDALAMHLFAGNKLAVRHAWTFDVQKYVWAVMPMLVDWIFAVPHMLAGESAARLLNLAFLGTTAALVRSLVAWAGGTDWAQRWAVLLLVSMPLTFTLGSSLFIELLWGSFVLAAILAALRLAAPQAEPEPGAARVAGLFLGLALAAKAVTLTLMPVLLAVLLLRGRHWWSRPAAWKVAQGVALMLLLGCLPYLNAWHRTGNPVFPFFNAVFRSPLYPIENFDPGPAFYRGLRWDFPYGVVFNSMRYLESTQGAGGFQWMLVIVPGAVALAFAWRRRALTLLAIAIVSMAIAFASVAYLRYVFPAFALTCAVAGLAVADTRWGTARRWILAAGAACAVLLNLVFLPSGSPYRDYPFWALIDGVHRDTWLELRMPMRRAITVLNSLNSAETPVAVLGQPVPGHLEADALIPSWYNWRFYHLMGSQRSGPDVAKALQDDGVDYLLLDSTWSQGPLLRQQVESVTEAVASFGGTSVRRWRPEYRFQQELLTNPRFEASGGWQFAGDSPGPGAGLVVTARTPASQTILVKPSRRYLNTITVICAQPALARAQVNWASAAGEFLKTDIQVHECGPEPATHQMEVLAPAGAAIATVYAVAHTAAPVEFKENSFRR